jgi:DNA-directed RNA polymerase specialized sigma24 family protein
VSAFLDRTALGRLLDRHESDVFNFCLRSLGSRDAAAIATRATFLRASRDPQAPLLAVARDETAKLMDGRLEDAAIMSSPLPVREANARLQPRYREVLALRELVGCSYEEMARILGADRETVAELLWRARLELRDELKGSKLVSIASVAASCRRALALIAMGWDRELHDGDQRDWLQHHLRSCGKCRVSQDAAREASVAYRAWPPAAPPVGMRELLLATGSAGRPAAGSETWSRRPAGSRSPGAPHGAPRSPG